MTPKSTVDAIDSYRAHFDQIYIAGIPCLLNNDGAFLSFLAVLTGTEALAGLYSPTLGNGDRFKIFVKRYYPEPLSAEYELLWTFRNSMVHSFTPGPYALTHHSSRNHLSITHGPKVLNAEDFYSALLSAAQKYFAELLTSDELQAHFMKRIFARDGGAPQIYRFEQP